MNGVFQLNRYRRLPATGGRNDAPSPVRRFTRDHAAVLRFVIDDVGIGRIDGANEAVAAAEIDPVADRRTGPPPRGARSAPALVVLQSAVDGVWLPGVDRDVVELRHREMAEEIPRLHAIVRDVQSAVASKDDVPRIGGVDPDRVMVGVNGAAAVAVEGLAAVLRRVKLNAEDVQDSFRPSDRLRFG